MTNTIPAKTDSPTRKKRRGRSNGVGLEPHKRTGVDLAIAFLTPIMGQEFLDKYNLRGPLNRGLRFGTKTLFSTTVKAARQFQRVQNLRGAPTRLKASGKDYFDSPRRRPEDDRRDGQ